MSQPSVSHSQPRHLPTSGNRITADHHRSCHRSDVRLDIDAVAETSHTVVPSSPSPILLLLTVTEPFQRSVVERDCIRNGPHYSVVVNRDTGNVAADHVANNTAPSSRADHTAVKAEPDIVAVYRCDS